SALPRIAEFARITARHRSTDSAAAPAIISPSFLSWRTALLASHEMIVRSLRPTAAAILEIVAPLAFNAAARSARFLRSAFAEVITCRGCGRGAGWSIWLISTSQKPSRRASRTEKNNRPPRPASPITNRRPFWLDQESGVRGGTGYDPAAAYPEASPKTI